MQVHEMTPPTLRPMAFLARLLVAAISLLASEAFGVSAQDLATWQLVRDVPIGPDQDFTYILAILPGVDGSVVIVDGRNNDIRLFDPAGQFMHRIGRLGSGPGEFRRVRAAGTLGDTVWVIDGGQPRVLLFGQDGSARGTIPIQSKVWLTALVPGGAVGSVTTPMGTMEQSRPHAVPVLLMTRTGEPLDTLAWLPSRNRMLYLGPKSDGSYTIGQQPFTDAGLTIIDPDASHLYVVDRTVASKSEDATFQITALRSRGDTLWSRRYAYTPRRNTQADSVWNAMRSRLTRQGHSEDQIRSGVFVPDYYPPVTSAFASDGLLWLRREEGRANVDYWVIRNDGRLIASVTVPADLTLMAAVDSAVWAVETDPYGVPTVARYRLKR
jgi:6-bladed beta-propeller